jgi:hypothetical protein
MPNGQYPGPVHPRRIEQNGQEYRYFFYDKHHRTGYSEDAQWLLDMTHDEEFAVFELAVARDLSNEKGDLYGLRLSPGGRRILMLGTREEQVAEFPVPRGDHPWHGYPVWPVTRQERDKTERKYGAPHEALRKMTLAGLITENQRKRLAKGKHAR